MFAAFHSWLKSLRAPKAPAYVPPPPAHRRESPAVNPGHGLPHALLGPRALDLILEFEGLDQPCKRPPGDSGITLGFGFDLGYVTPAEFSDAWKRHLVLSEFLALAGVIGLKGKAAAAVAARFRTFRTVTRAMGREVFDRCTIPKWTEAAAVAFPGLAVLTPDQQGVLVSLTFNRGTKMTGERRSEMRTIAAILRSTLPPSQKANSIAEQLRSMTRLWPDVPGLQRRRRAEANLMVAP